MLKLSVTMALVLAFGVTAAQAQIARHANTPPGLILSGVTIPPGAETLILSGQLAAPIQPGVTNSIEAFGDTQTQSISTLKRIETTLQQLGWSMKDVVKLTIFLVGDPKLDGRMDFAGWNTAYRQFFGTAENPNLTARSTVQVVALPGPYFLVEIEATAARIPTSAAR